MDERINLKELERKAWKSYFEDGLWDIFLGLILLNLGIGPLFEETTKLPYLVSALIILAIAELIFIGGKKYFTVPRIGMVTFDHSRQVRTRNVSLLLGISVGLGIVAFLLSGVIVTIHSAALLFCVMSILVFSGMAYLMEFPRLYLYGFFFAGSIPVIEIFRPLVGPVIAPLLGFGFFGSIMSLIGLAYLLHFIRKYPTPSKGVANGA